MNALQVFNNSNDILRTKYFMQFFKYFSYTGQCDIIYLRLLCEHKQLKCKHIKICPTCKMKMYDVILVGNVILMLLIANNFFKENLG